MKTEIDQYLAQQNELLNQQNELLVEQNASLMQEISSLKTTLNLYKKLEQDLNNKISDLEEENRVRKDLISQMKSKISQLEHGNFSAEFQQKLIANFSTQYQKLWMKVSEEQDLVNMLKNIVQTELKEEKTQLKTALLKVSQMSAPQDYSEEIETLISSVSDLKTQMRSVMSLLESLID